MKTVWKYSIPGRGRFTREMPAGARLLGCGLDLDQSPAFWALVDPALPREERTFEFVWTGDLLSDEGREWHGTMLLNGLICHLFEVRPEVTAAKETP